MMGRFFICGLSVVLVLSSQAAAKMEPPLSFEPTTEWTLSEQPETCVMTRSFASGERKALLQLDSISSPHSFRLTLATGDLKPRNRKLRFAFLPGEPQVHEYAVYSKLKDGRSAVAIDTGILAGTEKPRAEDDPWKAPSKAEFIAREKEADRIFLGDAFDRDIELATGSMRPALLVMNLCMSALMRRHGLDPGAIDAISSPAEIKDAKAWMEAVKGVFPSKEIAKAGSADLSLRLLVDGTGKVIECLAVPQEQPGTLAKDICASAKQQPFEPAHDAQGHPVASFYQTQIGFTSIKETRLIE